MQPNYYALLGITESATQRQIKNAYRQRMKEVHPDLAGHENTSEKRRREALAKEINQAYAVLSNPSLRRRYDSRRHRESAASASVNLVFYVMHGLLKISFSGLEMLLGKRKSRP